MSERNGFEPGVPCWVDTSVATTIERGGRAVVPAYDTPISRRAVLADPQGAVFSVSEVPS